MPAANQTKFLFTPISPNPHLSPHKMGLFFLNERNQEKKISRAGGVLGSPAPQSFSFFHSTLQIFCVVFRASPCDRVASYTPSGCAAPSFPSTSATRARCNTKASYTSTGSLLFWTVKLCTAFSLDSRFHVSSDIMGTSRSGYSFSPRTTISLIPYLSINSFILHRLSLLLILSASV